MAWPSRMARVQKAALCKTRLTLVGFKRRKWHCPRFSRSAESCAIEQDSINPGPQRRTTLELVEPLQDADRRLLSHLLGDSRGHVGAGQTNHCPMVALHQREEGSFVPRSNRGNLLEVRVSFHALLSEQSAPSG